MRLSTRTDPSSDAGRAGAAGLVVLVVLGIVGAGAFVWFRGSVIGIPVREHCTATASGKTTELDPEQAGNAAIIAGVAVKRKLPARAASIGIATAIQESKLRNIDYGDRDSLGLFQQRPSQGWGTAEEILDPVYATNAFYDELIKIEGYEALPVTEVAQSVQKSAFPDAYADHEADARIFASALSGYSEGALSCVLRKVDPSASASAGDPAARGAAVAAAAVQELDGAARSTASDDGTALTFRFSGGESGRRAWSLAQWAVARAGGLEVTRVDVDGKRWDRSEGASGWTTQDGTNSSTVVVHVA